MMFFYVLSLIQYMNYCNFGGGWSKVWAILFFLVGALLNLVRWAYNR